MKNKKNVYIEDNIKVNLTRLARQYDINIKAYDKAALLDLAHILRLWVDMKQDVYKFRPHVQFRSYGLTRDLKKLLIGKEYILTSLSGGGVTVYGNFDSETKNLMSSPDDRSKVTMQIRMKIKFLSQKEAVFYSFIVLYFKLDDAQEAILNKGITQQTFNYLQYLNSEAIRVCKIRDGKIQCERIPREILVKRVANILGGSHPEGDIETDNKYDPYVRDLMEHTFGGLPAPYLILLKAAKDILDFIKP